MIKIISNYFSKDAKKYEIKVGGPKISDRKHFYCSILKNLTKKLLAHIIFWKSTGAPYILSPSSRLKIL